MPAILTQRTIFQLVCCVVLGLAWWLFLGQTPVEARRQQVWKACLIAFGSWLGEESCIRGYDFYHYPTWWWLRLDQLPLLVAAIWPMVVLSAERVAEHLAPGGRGLARAAFVAALVTADASLVEVIAVRAGLWQWHEPGYLDVPVIGILGWACYAGAIVWVGERFRWAWWSPWLAWGLTHVQLQALWWTVFRWVRGTLAGLPTAMVVLACSVVVTVFLVPKVKYKIPWKTALPRVIAAGVFLALLIELELHAARPSYAHWLHLTAIALPYWRLTRFASAELHSR